MEFSDHPLRYKLANELHARPFPEISAPATVVHLAIKAPENAVSRDRALDRAHLLALLDRYGATHPAPNATHYYGKLGPYYLKWEQHTEFVTYTVIGNATSERAFDPACFDVFAPEWLDDAPGVRLTSAIVEIKQDEPADDVINSANDWFVPESVAVSEVLDGAAIIGGDFRIDTAGHMRFVVSAPKSTGDRRLGRVVQRLLEIEIYKSMSMLGLARARLISKDIEQMDQTLAHLIDGMAAPKSDTDHILQQLLGLSARLENILSQSAFRFSATHAYSRLVQERIEVLREGRVGGRQTFREFMLRRFDPSMRTVFSTEARLTSMSERARRAAELLRTQVDVARQKQNQSLLESMDHRADLQLKLQKTVEGLSVVAISYYAINLMLYILGPVPEWIGISKPLMGAGIAPLVILAVWWVVNRIKKMDH